MRNDFLTATKKHAIASMRDRKRRRAEGHDPHKPSLRSAPRNITVGKGGIRKGGASAPPSAEAKCERLQPLKYRCCLSNGVLTAGKLRWFSFRGPAHFHFRSTPNPACSSAGPAPRPTRPRVHFP